MRCQNGLFFFLILGLGLLWSCRNEPQQPAGGLVQVPDPAAAIHCYDGSGRPSPAGAGLAEGYAAAVAAIRPDAQQAQAFHGMVLIPGGEFLMGSQDAQARPDEQPPHPVRIDSFWMDAREVTVAEFRRFVEATGYVTLAEQPVDKAELLKQLPPGTELPPDIDLEPFALVFRSPTGSGPFGPADWWQMVHDANWRQPQGEAPTEAADQLPVVQISWYDAAAYCRWAGKRLPTEAEWEYAARGAKADAVYPWGNEPVTAARANFWQGTFPVVEETQDGFARRAPVGSFPPNGYGLYDMAGNVWEWVADWYRHDTYHREAAGAHNPLGPADSYDPQEPYVPKKVVRGGSFLCNDSYCAGYRAAARMKASPDTALEHTGCRCVREVKG